jgi:colanic acid/amylovoran biosynthesis glycosyltransferase
MIDTAIAIASVNKQQYSETFIGTHRHCLSKNVLDLFGGYLPTRYSLNGLADEQEIIEIKSGLFSKKKSLRSCILKLLQKNKIELVLAEYGPAGVEMAGICKQVGIPLIVHFHGFDAYRDDVLSVYGKKYPEMFETASAIIAVSNNMLEQLKKLGCPANKLFRIPYGISLQTFHRPAIKKTTQQFVSCGRFVPKKGPQYTIEAFAKVHKKNPETSLVMIGDGELLDECMQQVSNLDLQKAVSFTHALTPVKIAEVFSSSIAFLQHSMVDDQHDSEGLPLVILEAGASGLPVVSTLHAGIPDVIENGKDGFLVGEKDVHTMAEKILFLLDNPEQAQAMGKRLQQKIIENYSEERYVADLLRLIEQVLVRK